MTVAKAKKTETAVAKPASLRFAALVRVSTERQQQKGESLPTQISQCKSAVEFNEGHIVKTYGATESEHGTPGWERKEFERLLKDAQHDQFDAVIVTHADRWSRDNDKASDGLDIFREHGIRFFIGTREYDLHNHDDCLFLDITTGMGKHTAARLNKASMDSRIKRAQDRGWPVVGKLPYGRTFDRATGKWGIDRAKQRIIKTITRRYLAGESLAKLAVEFGMNHANLHKILNHRCGPAWIQKFRSKRFKIDVSIPTPVPPLLDDATIAAIRKRANDNRTFLHGQRGDNPYLLRSFVLCAGCGYKMYGQTNARGKRHYRHARPDRLRKCDAPPGWVRADEIEYVVMNHLFKVFNNAPAIQAAMEAAIPNANRVADTRDELKQIERDLVGIAVKLDRLIAAVEDGSLSKQEIRNRADRLRKQEGDLHERSKQLSASLANIPDANTIRDAAGQVMEFAPYIESYHDGCLDLISPDDQRALAVLVFGGHTADGKPMGVYVRLRSGGRSRSKVWDYKMIGHCIAKGRGFVPADDDRIESFAYPDIIGVGGDSARKLLDAEKAQHKSNGKNSVDGRRSSRVGKSASHSPGKAPRGRRFSARRFRHLK